MSNLGKSYNLKHGHARSHGRNSREYKSWIAMRVRCQSQQNKRFASYGGRGISVCARWDESFEAFFADMGQRPAGASIERVDRDGNYEPGNCRWATAKEQARNRSNNVNVEVRGEILCLSAIAEKYGFSKDTIYCRYEDGDRGEDLVRPFRTLSSRFAVTSAGFKNEQR